MIDHRRPADARRRLILKAGLSTTSAWLLLPGALGANDAAAMARPRGRHLSWIGDVHGSRTVTWFTDGRAAPVQVLEYGPVPAGANAADLASLPFPERRIAERSDTPFVDAETHVATASDFDPGQAIRYRVGSADGHWSEPAIVRPTPRGDFRFAHFGDHGRNPGSRAVARAIRARQPDFALLAGDLCYASGSSSLGPQEVWDDWFSQIEADLAADTVLMTAPGNHENEGNDGVAYRNRLRMPTRRASPDGTFYSFDVNRVHFVVSTGGAFAGDGRLATELLFLELDLANAALRRARGDIDFIVVCQHFTIWTDQEGRAPANFSLVALQENIFVRYRIDLLAVGHDHIYQRSHRMSFGLRNPFGYVQVTSGCGGQEIRGFEPRIQRWSAKELAQHLFVEYAVDRLAITGTTWGVDVASGETTVVDQFSLPRRDRESASGAVLPPREIADLHPDLDQLARQTTARNRAAMSDGHDHG